MLLRYSTLEFGSEENHVAGFAASVHSETLAFERQVAI